MVEFNFLSLDFDYFLHAPYLTYFLRLGPSHPNVCGHKLLNVIVSAPTRSVPSQRVALTTMSEPRPMVSGVGDGECQS
ncbi:hypothetical protein ACN42_g973 [Penicillium freii]|uniref:Uncharacterized protein n=1 Tax=Penicillium freii TaxID=48697 RepID=A0A117NRW3_PENFR|nr:hypothetical protein ACN42_g973 [Penicillium freii]